MITFGQFLEHKHNDSIVSECAHLMVEMEVNPYEYIYESLKEIDPVLAEGWWDGVKQFAGNAWNAAKQVGKSVWDGGGLKHGLKQAADTMSGPVAKFDAVERSLQDLVNLLKTDKRFERFQSSTGQGHISDYLGKVLADLQKDKAAVPQMLNTQVDQNYGTRQDLANQNAQAAAAAAAAPLTPGASAAPPQQSNQPARRANPRRRAGP